LRALDHTTQGVNHVNINSSSKMLFEGARSTSQAHDDPMVI